VFVKDIEMIKICPNIFPMRKLEADAAEWPAGTGVWGKVGR
jgi:hypothetical protein